MAQGTRSFLIIALITLPIAAMLQLLSLLLVSGTWAAAVHLTLFGWISAMIFTVNYHTVPVFSGRDFPYPRLIDMHWILFAGGVSLATIGMLLNQPAMVMLGLLLEFIAALLFITNITTLFLRGPKRTHHPPVPPIPDLPRIDRAASWATRGSALCLPLSLLGLLAVRLGWISGMWILAAEHLAALGWVMLMIVGVAYHVLPRFTGRGLRGAIWVQAQLLSHIMALMLIVLALGFGWSPIFAAGGVVMSLAIGLFIWSIWPALAVARARPLSIQIPLEERPR